MGFSRGQEPELDDTDLGSSSGKLLDPNDQIYVGVKGFL